jgi:hypothetical protein
MKEAKLSMQLAVEVRNKVIEAYGKFRGGGSGLICSF